MGDIVNFNRARKARAKAQAGQTARLNRAHFGADKAEKSLTQAEREAADRRLDGARRDDD